ncbi:hypothetical protein LX36DRAFT_652780 [Colletotrichum falcatum]|nr:hypothetical protein LX36DRAFT_652780 [Colletotrichum falcatum]
MDKEETLQRLLVRHKCPENDGWAGFAVGGCPHNRWPGGVHPIPSPTPSRQRDYVVSS